MDRNHFESYLLGRLSAIEEQFKVQPVVMPEPRPEPSLAERWQQEQAAKAQADQDFLDHLEERAGVAKAPAAPPPDQPPATLSKASPRYARDFAKYAEAIAAGKTEVVD